MVRAAALARQPGPPKSRYVGEEGSAFLYPIFGPCPGPGKNGCGPVGGACFSVGLSNLETASSDAWLTACTLSGVGLTRVGFCAFLRRP